MAVDIEWSPFGSLWSFEMSGGPLIFIQARLEKECLSNLAIRMDGGATFATQVDLV